VRAHGALQVCCQYLAVVPQAYVMYYPIHQQDLHDMPLSPLGVAQPTGLQHGPHVLAMRCGSGPNPPSLCRWSGGSKPPLALPLSEPAPARKRLRTRRWILHTISCKIGALGE
jgi:hypothetical protein